MDAVVMIGLLVIWVVLLAICQHMQAKCPDCGEKMALKGEWAGKDEHYCDVCDRWFVGL